MKQVGSVFIAAAILLIFIACIIAVGNYLGEVYAFFTFIAELIIVGVILIKLGDKI